MKDKKSLIFVCLFLILMYGIGIVTMTGSSVASLFLSFTPVTLLLTLIFLIYFQNNKNRFFYVFLIIGFSLGFLIEVVGVNSGFPFGNYQYGKYLGIKLFNTPLSIGINWLLLSLSIGSICNIFLNKLFPKIIIASAVMVIVDYLIEPVAIHFNWWTWEIGLPPLENYSGWFFSSMIIFFFYYKFPFEKRNDLALPLLIILMLFFVITGLIVD